MSTASSAGSAAGDSAQVPVPDPPIPTLTGADAWLRRFSGSVAAVSGAHGIDSR